MGNSLFDQLKKSGLVDDKKAKKVKQSQYKNKKQKSKKGAAKDVDEAKLRAQQIQAEKVERDRLLNQQKKQEAEQKAVAAQIKQLIETNRVTDSEGDIAYNFTDANVVKRLYISETIHRHLSNGRLAIAKQGDGYELVPSPVAEKIKQRDAQRIITCERCADIEANEEDPYAEYIIPDDLMW